jgi:hypothetical protein
MKDRPAAIITAILVVLVCIVFWVALFNSKARSHSWYPAACCSDGDCFPLAENAVEEYAAGWRITAAGEFISRANGKQSQDSMYHLCRSPQWKQIRCFFYPYRGT